MGMVTGTLKNFIDRTCVWYHRPQLTGKAFLPAATTMGSRLKETLDYLALTGIQWGMIPSGKIGRSVMHMDEDLTKKEMTPFLHSLFAPPKRHTPSGKILRFFSVQKVLALKILENDRLYWQNKGWDTKYYYYSCRTSVFSRLSAFLLYQLLNIVIKPQKK